MTYIKQLNRVVQQGRGVAASVLGQTYSVYRINSSTVGSVISSNSLVYPSFQMYFKKASKTHLENTMFDLQTFEATCDGTKLRVGDILKENGYESDGGIYCVGQLRPMKTNILIRVESPSAIEKPHPDAGASEDQPNSGFVYIPDKFGGIRLAGRYELTLQGGLYSIQKQGLGTPASIPIGLQPINRVGEGHKPNLPTTVPVTKFLCYIPPTPGYAPNELDVIKGLSMESYSISMVYTSEGVGVQGTICVLTKMAA